GVAGIVALNKKSGKPESIGAKNVIVASGAPACIYESSVYPHSQHGMTGVLIEAGTSLCNYSQWQYGMASVDFRWNVSGSFMQVIPRFVSVDENGEEREFLKDSFESDTELFTSVFLKGYQWPFSFDRIGASSRIDVAVHKQTCLGRKVYLDFTKNPEGFDIALLSDEARDYLTVTGATQGSPIERLKALNPKAIAIYADNGIDITSEKLRIAVCAQHNNGGIYTDENYMTSIEGLYVIGEAAGSFGLTRPGGSALNDTQVGGLVCARHIKNSQRVSSDESVIENAEKETVSFSEGFEVDSSIDYSDIKREMSNCASFLRDYEKCVSLLGKIEVTIKNMPMKHKNIGQYFLDKDMLISARELLRTIVAEMPETGSRGGAVFIKDGKIIPENENYRHFLTVTENGNIKFVKASPLPSVSKPFEAYLKEI
ncbi:MAG: FAD-binding protein, partial [Clostridia bacterium]|nr:FAD-binding protein [Clostridia bacterium]